jgi:hypothetical protein
LLPLSQVLPFDPAADRSSAITSRIQNAMSSSAFLYGLNFGWQTTLFPSQDLLILNVPIIENSSQNQYVMNTLTGAWCRFTGWNANCFAFSENNLYWGSNDGKVNLGYFGDNDMGQAIQGDVQFAFNYFEDAGRLKRATMIQPLVTVEATEVSTLTLALDADFQDTGAASATVFTTDNTWLSAQGIGHALAVHLMVTTVVNVLNITSSFGGTFADTQEWDQVVIESLPTIQLNAFNVILEYGGFI